MISLGFLLATTISKQSGWNPSRSVRTPILTYHDVIPRRDARSLWFDCTPQELESQLQTLERGGATFVSLEAVAEHLEGKARLPLGAIAITFADNYRGFIELAYPILRKHRVPVTMFVHTGYVGSSVGRPKMSWSQLRQLQSDGLVTVASQTVTHPADLSKLSDRDIKSEFVASRLEIMGRLGRPVEFLAYPNGKFDARCIRIAKEAGYRMAFSEVQAPVEKSPGPFAVNRYVHTKWRKAWADARKNAINLRVGRQKAAKS